MVDYFNINKKLNVIIKILENSKSIFKILIDYYCTIINYINVCFKNSWLEFNNILK